MFYTHYSNEFFQQLWRRHYLLLSAKETVAVEGDLPGPCSLGARPPSPALSSCPKCSLANTGHGARPGRAGGPRRLQQPPPPKTKRTSDAPNSAANSNSQLQTSEHHPKSHLHFWAPLKRARSFGVSPTSIILAPAKSCMMRPEVTMGEIPSSISVP